MYFLGLSAFGDGSAACLLRDGEPIAAAFEERFSRTKHDSSLPLRAVRSCLRQAGIEPHQLESVVFYEKPLRRFERVFVSQMGNFPRSCASFADHLFLWLGERLWLKGQIGAELGVPLEKIHFTQHMIAHAASAFYASGFEDAAILCIDGAGEWESTALLHGHGKHVNQVQAIQFPHSLVSLTSSVAQFLGFIPGADDHKVFELAAFGEPRFAKEFETLLVIHADGSYSVDQAAVRFAFDEKQMFATDLERRLGPRRVPGAALRRSGSDTRDADVAASLQQRLGQAFDALLAKLSQSVSSKALCLAGSLALDPWLNARIVASGLFERVFAQPAGRDAGGALGAALYAWHAGLGRERNWSQRHSFLGEFPDRGASAEPLVAAAKSSTLPEDARAWASAVAPHLAAGQLLGLVRGRFEFGHRSLGHRSLLMHALAPAAKRRINEGLKHREEFRPMALAVPQQVADRWFDIPAAGRELARYKLLAVRPRAEFAQRCPEALHRDGTCVIQSVDAEHNEHFEQVLTQLGLQTGVPVAYCAALHARGDPPVRGRTDALALFERSALDALVVESTLYER